jgi:hypothetical protein
MKIKNLIRTGLITNYDFGNCRSSKLGSIAVNDLFDSHHSTIYGGTINTNLGGSITLNGTSDYINVDIPYALVSATNSLTINMWVKCVVGATDQTFLNDRPENATNGFLNIYRLASTDNLYFRYAAGAATRTIAVAGFFTGYDDKWLNLTVTVDFTAKNVTIYRNGNILSNQISSFTMAFPASLSSKYIGRTQTNLNFLNGSISQFQIYDYKQTSDEVLYNYNALKYRNKLNDSDANYFITQSGLTNPIHINAIQNLVQDLKNYNLYARIKALYPFVGGTATSHKFNLINPNDTDAAFRLLFAGGIIHDSNGVTFDGINGYANTFLNPNPIITLNKETLALYSRTSSDGGTGVDMGAATNTNVRNQIQIRTNTNEITAHINSTTGGSLSISGIIDGSGFFMSSRQTSTDLRTYINGIQVGLSTILNNGIRCTIPIYIGARNVANVSGSFVNKNFAIAVIAAEYTPEEAKIFYNIVQKYQTLLGRQV